MKCNSLAVLGLEFCSLGLEILVWCISVIDRYMRNFKIAFPDSTCLELVLVKSMHPAVAEKLRDVVFIEHLSTDEIPCSSRAM